MTSRKRSYWRTWGGVAIMVVFLLLGYNSANGPVGNTNPQYHQFMSARIMTGFLEDVDRKLLYSSMYEPLIARFYQIYNYQPQWTQNGILNNKARDLLELIDEAAVFGLSPQFYRGKEIKQLAAGLSGNDDVLSRSYHIANLEFKLTKSAIELMAHLSKGIRFTSVFFPYEYENLLLPIELASILESGDVKGGMRALQPDNERYKKLQKAFEYFLRTTGMHHRHLWEMDISDGKCLLPVFELNGFCPLGTSVSVNNMEELIASYQKAKGISVNGKMDEMTLALLDVEARQRCRTIALNLDRMRDAGSPEMNYVFVNVPSYEMSVYENHEEKERFNVVVGHPDTPTPNLSGKLQRIVTYPEWNVPRSITKREMIPIIKRDPGYLDRKNYYLVDRSNNLVDIDTIDLAELSEEYFPYRIIQNAGRSNSLGTIKFMFPNDSSIYLHDTNARGYFYRKNRALSHGCIRVSYPLRLAKHLLGERNDSLVVDLMESEITATIKIDNDFDVYIRYLTCLVDEQHNIVFYDDIYNKDQREMVQLGI